MRSLITGARGPGGFRIYTAPSLSTRRQAGSHGASQTRPQMELKGLVEVIA